MLLSNEEHMPIETAPIIWFVFDKMYPVVHPCQIDRATCFFAQQSVSIKDKYWSVKKLHSFVVNLKTKFNFILEFLV